MAIKKTNFEPDVFGAAMPGQSLTANPGQFPYEKPPMTVKPEEAMESIVDTIRKPALSKSLGKLMEAGVSAEALASGLVLGAVSEGAFDADVAELIKPALIFYMVEIGNDQGVEDINVLDTLPDQGMSEADGLMLLEKTSPKDRLPKKIKQLEGYVSNMNDLDEEEEMMGEEPMQEEDMSMGFIDRNRGVN